MSYQEDIVNYLEENLQLGQRIVASGGAVDTERLPQIVAMEFGRSAESDALHRFITPNGSTKLAADLELRIWRTIKSYAYFISYDGELTAVKGSVNLAQELCNALRHLSEDDRLKLVEDLVEWNGELERILKH